MSNKLFITTKLNNRAIRFNQFMRTYPYMRLPRQRVEVFIGNC